MHTFQYSKDSIHFETNTVAELIELLKQYPTDMPVCTTWEGTTHGLSDPRVEQYAGIAVLMFDVEYDTL